MKIIAEVGSNYNSIDDCKNSIAMAAAVGANAVKFQLYTHRSLYGYDTEMLMWDLPRHWVPILKECADKNKIEFMCTAFSPDEADWVNEFVGCHKVASAEMLHIPLLEKLNSYSKPIYLSTGAHNAMEITLALKYLHKCKVTLMHCVSSYPALDANLGRIEVLRKLFDLPVGYSDHTLDITTIPALAVHGFGITVLEKHFKINNTFNPKTPDQDHSLNPAQFERMIKAIHKTELPSSQYGPDENAMVLKYNRRLMAIKDIAVGDKLIKDVNYGCYRSKVDALDSLAPWHYYKVDGVKAIREIKIGEPIRGSYLETGEL